MKARRRRHTAAVQDTADSKDSNHAQSCGPESRVLRSSRPRRSLPLRKARYRGLPSPLRGSLLHAIVIDSDSDSDNIEAGAVSLLFKDGGVNESHKEEDEDEGMASLPRLGRGLIAKEDMELVDNKTGLWNSELVRSKKASRWLVRVEGASRLLL